jgi:DHA1 family multidrug resistance protein-like MFS transporter
LGGLLAKQSLALPFFIAAGLSFLALLLIAIFLPESLPEAQRQAPEAQRQAPEAQRQAFAVHPAGSRLRLMLQSLSGPIGVLLGITFLVSYALTAFSGIFGLYAAQKYQYGPGQVGNLLVVVGIVMLVAQGIFTGPLTRRWGEPAVIRFSLLAAGLGFAAMALAASKTAILASIALFSMGLALLTPSVTALISKRSTLEHGLTMGLNNAFESLGRIFGPLAAGLLFDFSQDLPYWSGAAVMLAGFLLALARISGIRQKEIRPPTLSTINR